MEWSKNRTIRLIKLFKANEVLWNSSVRRYKDRNKKQDAINGIAKELQLSPLDVDQKIQSLRSQFCREVARERKTCMSDGFNERYVSKWYGYELLSFLRYNKSVKNRKISKKPIPINSEYVDCGDECSSEYNLALDTNRNIECKIEETIQEETLTILKEARNNVIDNTQEKRDEFDTFGEFVANELRTTKDKMKQLLMKKRITDDIFEVKISELKKNL